MTWVFVAWIITQGVSTTVIEFSTESACKEFKSRYDKEAPEFYNVFRKSSCIPRGN